VTGRICLKRWTIFRDSQESAERGSLAEFAGASFGARASTRFLYAADTRRIAAVSALANQNAALRGRFRRGRRLGISASSRISGCRSSWLANTRSPERPHLRGHRGLNIGSSFSAMTQKRSSGSSSTETCSRDLRRESQVGVVVRMRSLVLRARDVNIRYGSRRLCDQIVDQIPDVRLITPSSEASAVLPVLPATLPGLLPHPPLLTPTRHTHPVCI